MSNANRHPYVFSYPEIIGLFITFLTILFLLHHENDLEKLVLKESSNYDLTAIYLENMLKHDPKNEKLMLALATTAQKSGNIDLSMKLLTVLKNTKDKSILDKMDKIRYYLLKNRMEHLSKSEKIIAKEDMNKILTNIFNKPLKSMSFIKEWYDEAMWLNDFRSAYRLTTLALKNEEDSYWLKQHYLLALKLHYDEEAEKTFKKLLKFDLSHKEDWLKEIYYSASDNEEYKEAEVILLKLKSISPTWEGEHAQLALRMREYAKASKIYLSLFKKSEDYEVKKAFFIKAINALQYGNLYDEAVSLAKQYDKTYIHDPMMREFFLKLYLSANDLEAASDFSQELLKEGIK